MASDRRAPFRSLYGRLLLLVLIALVPVFAAAGYGSLVQFRRAETDAYDMARRAVRLSVRRNEQVVTRARAILNALADAPAPVDVQRLCEQLRRLPVNTDPGEAADAGVANASAQVLCTASGEGSGASLGPEGELAVRAAAESGTFAVGGYEISRDSRDSTLMVARPLESRGPQQLLLFASLSLSWFETLVSDLQLPPESALTIVNADAVVMARSPDPGRWVGRVIAEGPLFQLITGPDREGAGETIGVDGVRRIYAFAALTRDETPEAYVAVGIPSEYALREAGQSLFRNIAGLLAAAVIALTMARVAAERWVLRKARALTAAAQRMAAGDLSARVGDTADDDELAHLARAFDEMAANVERAHRIEQQQLERLDFLSRELLRAQEKERQHIARELHDEIGQSLTALKINLQIEQATSRSAGRLEDSIAIINRMLTEIRALSLTLRPPLLDEAGLRTALKYLLESESQRTGITIVERITIGDVRYRPELELVAYRIAQEALTNAIRHSRASEVVATVEQRGAMLEVSISDNGVGFEPSALPARGGFGLLSMQERAVLAGGALQVDSAPGQGTSVRLLLPVTEP